jgi:hypothetical protein
MGRKSIISENLSHEKRTFQDITDVVQYDLIYFTHLIGSSTRIVVEEIFKKMYSFKKGRCFVTYACRTSNKKCHVIVRFSVENYLSTRKA